MSKVDVALALTQVSKSFPTSKGDRLVLRDLSLELSAGSLTALVGRSGSGKTTALNLISGLAEPTTGTIRILGQDLAQLGRVGKRRLLQASIGRVYQHFDLFDELTVLENIMLPSELSGASEQYARAAASELLHSMGLSEISSSRASDISGGEKQRTAIARALAMNLPILLADEPTGNLDRENAVMVAEALVAARDAGVCVLVATHDPIVRDVCEVQYVLD